MSEDCFLFLLPSSLTGTQAKDEESRRKRFAIPTIPFRMNAFQRETVKMKKIRHVFA